MNLNSILFVLVIIGCCCFIVVCIIRRRPDLLLNLALRACFGTAGIYLLNLAFGIGGYSINVGINSATVLANAFLGLPGFLLLYGLSLYYFY